MKNVRFIGLDVHAETIAAAVAEPGGAMPEPLSATMMATRPSASRLADKAMRPAGASRSASIAFRTATMTVISRDKCYRLLG
jgi:hypothetical protein